jgi:hypothetical protein
MTKSQQVEEAQVIRFIPPKGSFEKFQNDTHYAEKVKEWGLSATKKEFWYKTRSHHYAVSIIGYEISGHSAEYNTVVIEFQDGKRTCIHPAYLKEMQSSSFGKEITVKADLELADAEIADNPIPASYEQQQPTSIKEPTSINEKGENVTKPVKEIKAKKEKTVKLILPEDKVHFSAHVKQFAYSWNHFNEENDEVVVLENVKISLDESLEVGFAWCAHSKTLKKYELSPGDQLEFDGKIVKKSLPKGKDVEDESFILDVSVAYKINNPSKISKI